MDDAGEWVFKHEASYWQTRAKGNFEDLDLW